MFVTLRHVHYEYGDAIGVADTLGGAQEIASAAWRSSVSSDDWPLAWSHGAPESKSAMSCWVGQAAGDPGVSFEVLEFEVSR